MRLTPSDTHDSPLAWNFIKLVRLENIYLCEIPHIALLIYINESKEYLYIYILYIERWIDRQIDK